MWNLLRPASKMEPECNVLCVCVCILMAIRSQAAEGEVGIFWIHVWKYIQEGCSSYTSYDDADDDDDYVDGDDDDDCDDAAMS